MNLDSDNLSDRSRNTQAASLEFLCFKLTLVTRRSDLDVSSNFNKQSFEKVTAPQLLILI